MNAHRALRRAPRAVTLLAVLVLLAVVPAGLVPAALAPAAAETACPAGATLVVVAHPDDDLLFLEPDVTGDLQAGRCVRTVYLTTGDAGNGVGYWSGREAGVQAAYARMAGVTDRWTVGDAGVPGHPVRLVTLDARPQVSLAFLRLPDGGWDGNGTYEYGFQSLRGLWTGRLATLAALDGTTSYTRTGLVDALRSMMVTFGADQVWAMDWVGDIGGNDHPDHFVAGDVTREAHASYAQAHTARAYQGYGIASRPQNLTAAQRDAKRDTYFTYAAYDSLACKTVGSCTSEGVAPWWSRRYVLASEGPPVNQAPVARAGADQQVLTGAQVTLDGS
ncbi:MAG TPA: PIG-L family deacetylase, partial [Jiangellales bacterium]|nr:PIG-L family deacetylase [Jiangellales bacterium]